MKNFFTLLLLTFLTGSMFAQGVTTSSMKGKIVDSNGEELIGATVQAKHGPTGSSYGTDTDIEGNYNISNMKVGGPYTITVSYTGYADQVLENVTLRLGEPFRRDFNMSEEAINLEGIEVVAQSGAAGENSGSSTQIGSDQIENLPTLNRSLNDYTRLTPQSKQTNGGGTSIAGTNNRYNAIYVDGAVNNDVFGLSDSGTNGGQTGISPVSMDIIDQIQVVVSPYDVSFGGFAGGGINAVTKSGTNDLKGTAYYFLQNQGMAGKTNSLLTDRTGDDREKLDDFTQTTYGASLGGALKKDKIFFFTNVEIQKDETPLPFDIGSYDGASSQQELNELQDFVQNTYNYTPGTFLDKADELEGLKIFGKLDFNLNNDHKLTVRHQYTKADFNNAIGSSSRSLNAANNGYVLNSVTNTSAIELNSSFGSKASNNLIIGFTSVRDDRDQTNQDFPNVRIADGDANIFFGGEAFSSANVLNQDILTLTDNFKLYKGNHVITLGTHNEFSSFRNVFVAQNYGAYRFSSIESFMNGESGTRFDRSYSLVDDISGDETAAAADFSAIQLGFYVQDDWEVNNKFTLTGGLRFDIPFLLDDAPIHSSFNTTTLPLLEQHYDLEGTRGGESPKSSILISPRIGFNYKISQQTKLRGGLGIFTSRIPFVWPGGQFTNNGVTIGSVRSFQNVPFIADVNNQYVNENFTIPSGKIDLFAKDFKYPQVFRTSLAVDHKFKNGINATVEGIFSKTLNNVLYTNINTDPTVDFTWTGSPDDRPVFTGNLIDPTYNDIYLASNTSEGYTYNISTSLSKTFNSGLNLYVAYSYGDAQAVVEGTSSQNSSQWRGTFNTDGRNNPLLGRSDFSAGSRFVGSATYGINWANDYAKTSISLFYNGQSGDPYSYVYGTDDGENLNNETGSVGRNRSLIYIPASAADINLIDIPDGATAAEQWTALNNFIEQDDYLSENRGSYAGKNESRTPFTHSIDVRLTQEFKVNKNKFELTFDVFNFGNMINSAWGVVYNNPFDYRLINYVGQDGTNPQFTFTEGDLGDERFDIADRVSRWRMRLGLRYTFN